MADEVSAGDKMNVRKFVDRLNQQDGPIMTVLGAKAKPPVPEKPNTLQVKRSEPATSPLSAALNSDLKTRFEKLQSESMVHQAKARVVSGGLQHASQNSGVASTGCRPRNKSENLESGDADDVLLTIGRKRDSDASTNEFCEKENDSSLNDEDYLAPDIPPKNAEVARRNRLPPKPPRFKSLSEEPPPEPTVDHSHQNPKQEAQIIKAKPRKSLQMQNVENAEKVGGKAKRKYRRRQLPEEIGEPPVKPIRPPNVRLPMNRRRLPSLPKEISEDQDELYDDTDSQAEIFAQDSRPHSLIPEMTEEEEGKIVGFKNTRKSLESPPELPQRHLPPRIPPATAPARQQSEEETDEFYTDVAVDPQVESDLFYECMDDEVAPGEQRRMSKSKPSVYERFKKLKTEISEKKIEKSGDSDWTETKKILKLTGRERVLQTGFVMENWEGETSCGDLSVKRDEKIFVIRMDNTPSGRWLVQNIYGQVGFVPEDNIEVEPLP